MKVLLINSVCGIRSTGRICTDLAEVLERDGHECKIAYGRLEVPEKYRKYAVKVGNAFVLKADAVLTRFLDNAGLNSYSSTKKLIKQIKEYNPDIIHLHNIHGYYINIRVLFDFLRSFGRPVVWTLHDCWAFTGHCAHFTVAGCEKWKTGCYGCKRKNTYPKSILLSRAKRNYRLKKELFTQLDNMTIVTPSEWLADVTRRSFLNKYPVHAIPNGVDLSVFRPTDGDFRQRYGLEGKKIILGVASAWGQSKGIDDFVALNEIVGDDYKIVIVGMGEGESSRLPEDILVIPRTNDVKELAEIYTAADVFFNPSKEETMGLTTVEAMACGTPVVTSDLTAVPEVVSPESGIVLGDITPQSVLSAVEEVLSGSYTVTVERAEKYEKSAQYRKYLELYKALLEET